MANKQSALKEIRKTVKRTEHNSRIKTNFKHLFRACTDLIQDGDMEGAKAKAIEFQQTADKAAKRHVISKNRANRKKAALAAMLNGKREVPVLKGKGRSKAKAKPAVKVEAPKPEATPAPTPEVTEEPKKEEEIKNEA
jgi:ribosomal protein S20